MELDILSLFNYYRTRWAAVRTHELKDCIDNNEELILHHEDETMTIRKEEFVGKSLDDFFMISNKVYDSKFPGEEPYQLYYFEFNPGVYINKAKEKKDELEEEEERQNSLFDPLPG